MIHLQQLSTKYPNNKFEYTNNKLLMDNEIISIDPNNLINQLPFEHLWYHIDCWLRKRQYKKLGLVK